MHAASRPASGRAEVAPEAAQPDNPESDMRSAALAEDHVHGTARDARQAFLLPNGRALQVHAMFPRLISAALTVDQCCTYASRWHQIC